MTADLTSTAAEMLRDARESMGLTQAELAARAGIGAAALASYETGRRPLTLELLERVLGVCGVRVRAVAEMVLDERERRLAALVATSVSDRLPDTCRRAVEWASEFDLRWGGALAACLQGVPVLPRWPVLAVTVDELPVIARGRERAWWWGPVDTAQLRLAGRLRGEDGYGRPTEIMLLPRPVRERHAVHLHSPLRLVAAEDLSPEDADPDLVRMVERAGRLAGWPLQPPAPITGKVVIADVDGEPVVTWGSWI